MKRNVLGILAVVVALFAIAAAPADAQTAPAPPSAPVLAQTPAPPPPPDVQAVKPAAPAPAATAPAAPKPFSPFQIKVGDASIRFGLLLQPQAHFQENANGTTSQNMMLRRARLLIGGQITKNVFFFWETDHARMGNANAQGVKTMATGFQTLDAAVEWRKSKPLNISAGLIRVPTSRDALESSSNEFTLDFNSYAFTATTALAGTAGRDTGVQARGFFFDDRFEYRASLVSGIRQAGSSNTFRRTGRVQYNFFDKELYNFVSYAGNNFGSKKIVAIGAAYDEQLTYSGATADLFVDVPTSFGSALSTVTLQKLDGGSKVALPKSDILTIDGGVIFKGTKIGPWARYERRDFDASGLGETRAMVGLNYYPFGNNFNVKAAIGRFSPTTGQDQNQFTIQLQAFYY